MAISMSSASLPIFRTMLGNLATSSTRGWPTRRRGSSTRRCCVRTAWPRTCCRSRARSRSPAMPPRTAWRASRASRRRSSRTTSRRSRSCKARIAKTLAWLDTVPAAQLDGTEDKEITFPVGRETTRTMKGEAYLKHLGAAQLLLPRRRWPTPSCGTTASSWARPTTWRAPPGRPLSLGGGRFEGGQPVELGADVGHAAGDHHAAGGGGGMAGVDHAQHAQRRDWPRAGLRRPCDMARCAGAGLCRQRRGRGDGVGASGRTGRPASAIAMCAPGPEFGHRQDCERGRSRRVMALAPYARHLRRSGVGYISMVLRIRPTARPSISKGSPGSTTMVG